MGFQERLYGAVPGWAQTMLLNAHALRIAQHRYGTAYRREVAALLAMERWPRPQVRSYQNARIREISRHAFAHSSYYRQCLTGAGFGPGGISCVEELARLPVLHKEVLKNRGAELLTSARSRAGWLHGHTSGTTGTPLSLWYDRQTAIMTNAVDRQQKAWAGMGADEWIGMFLGRVVVPVNQTRPPFWRTNLVQKQVWFSSFHMTDRTLPQYVAEIRRRRMRFLEGYPSTMFIVARYLRSIGQTLPLKAVFTSSETLHVTQRQTIEAAFAAPLFDFYGMAERAVFAAECDYHEGKHLAETFGFTEIVDDEGRPVPDGDVGYVVGTSLHNTAMPLLRYRTSDMSAIEPTGCACGRTSRLLRNITTKAEDIVILPSGRMVSPSILTHPFKPFDQIAKSQIVQESTDLFIVRVVARDHFTQVQELELLGSLRDRLGEGVTVRLERVEDIPREASGKFRWVISKVPHPLKVSWTD